MEMDLKKIPDRHRGDRWKDAIFIIAAVLLVAVSIGSVTSKAQGNVTERAWKLTLVDPQTNVEIGR